eukprot:scaffold205227_cov29-Tisochrysis_lutea.AAC.3
MVSYRGATARRTARGSPPARRDATLALALAGPPLVSTILMPWPLGSDLASTSSSADRRRFLLSAEREHECDRSGESWPETPPPNDSCPPEPSTSPQAEAVMMSDGSKYRGLADRGTRVRASWHRMTSSPTCRCNCTSKPHADGRSAGSCRVLCEARSCKSFVSRRSARPSSDRGDESREPRSR